MAIKKKIFSILYSIKNICIKKGDTCDDCPFQAYKGCEMKRITGTYPIAWKELKDEH